MSQFQIQEIRIFTEKGLTFSEVSLDIVIVLYRTFTHNFVASSTVASAL